jgi:hypothetical protein
MSFAFHATLELRELNYDTLCIENVPRIPSIFYLDFFWNSPLLIIQIAILVRCKEWTQNTMAIFGARSRRKTSIMIKCKYVN